MPSSSIDLHGGTPSGPASNDAAGWAIRPLSWMVLAAVVVGVALGAMACAAGHVGASGQHVRAPWTDTMPAPVAGPHQRQATADPGDAGEDLSLEALAARNDPRSGSAGHRSENHADAACVVIVDLHAAELATPVVASRFDTPGTLLPVDCVVDLDPPVPRVS